MLYREGRNKHVYVYMGVSKYRGGPPKSSHFTRVFHYKPSILRFSTYFWKHPYISIRYTDFSHFLPRLVYISLHFKTRYLYVDFQPSDFPRLFWSVSRCGIWLGLLMVVWASDDTCYLELRHEACRGSSWSFHRGPSCVKKGECYLITALCICNHPYMIRCVSLDLSM